MCRANPSPPLLSPRKSRSPARGYTVTTHYYKPPKNEGMESRRFEQSLDVYEPIRDDDEHDDDEPTTTILLVMGSGWLGHAWWAYSVTGAFNAGGPRALARAGYRCVSIRHSGAFFKVPSPAALLPVVPGGAVDEEERWWWLVVAVAAWCMVAAVALPLGIKMSGASPDGLLRGLGGLVLAWTFLWHQGRGAAGIAAMVDDVADAIRFVHGDLGFGSRTPVVLGGYSSGGHVLATLLSEHPGKIDGLRLAKPGTTNKKDNDYDDNEQTQDWIRGILYLSGVLSLDSWVIRLVAGLLFDIKDGPGSPLYGPLPPCHHHLVVGCRHETFGLPVLDGAFCAEGYADKLRSGKIPAKCVLLPEQPPSGILRTVSTNHWTILTSPCLLEALERHLPWLMASSSS